MFRVIFRVLCTRPEMFTSAVVAAIVASSYSVFLSVGSVGEFGGKSNS